MKVFSWFWRLIPGNPQLVRIVQGGSRKKSHDLFRMGYLAVLMLLMVFAILGTGGLQTLNLNELAQGGAQVFRIIAYTQIVLVCLLAPLMMAAALGNEQANETYEILLTTPLSSAQIVLGSLLGRWFFIAALLISGQPLFAVLLLFGGVPLTSVLTAFGVALATGLFVGSVAVTISVFRLGGRRTVFAFVIAVAGYLLGAQALDLLLLRRMASSLGTTTWLTPLHPLLVLESVVQQANYAKPTPESLADVPGWWAWFRMHPVPVFFLWTVGGSVVLTVLNALALRPVSQGQWAWMRTVSEWIGGKKHRPGRTVGKHAIAWREAHARGKGLLPWMGRVGYLLFSAGFAVVLLVGLKNDSLPAITADRGGALVPLTPREVFQGGLLIFLLMQVAVLALVAIYVSAASVSKEREDGTLDLILTTPVTPKQYVWGKLHGLVRALVVLALGPVCTIATVVVGNVWLQQDQAAYQTQPLAMVESPLLMVLFLVPFVAACVAFGMSRSLVSRTVISAVAQSIAMAGLLGLVFGFCGMAAVQNLPLVGPAVNAISPFTGLAMLVDPWGNVADFQTNTAASRAAMFFGGLASTLVYGLVVQGMVAAMVRSFDHTVRKLSGKS